MTIKNVKIIKMREAQVNVDKMTVMRDNERSAYAL